MLKGSDVMSDKLYYLHHSENFRVSKEVEELTKEEIKERIKELEQESEDL